MEQEVAWKYYDNKYLVSSAGDVWSEYTHKLLKPTLDGRGYLQLILYGKSVKIHYMVAICFIGAPPDESDTVNHKNLVKTDNRSCNLEWLSRSANVKHAHTSGVMPYGQDHGAAKLTDEDVLKIKQLFVEYKLGNTEIASRFNVGYTTIGKIRNGSIWKNVGAHLVFKPIGPRGLSGEDIPKIRALHKEGHYTSAIARLYGVNEVTIRSVLKGRSWVNY
jgi:hypothetical protein